MKETTNKNAIEIMEEWNGFLANLLYAKPLVETKAFHPMGIIPSRLMLLQLCNRTIASL